MKAKADLQRKEELYRRAIAGAGAVPYSYEYATRTYLFIGEGIEKLTGYTAKEISSSLWKKIIQETVMLGESAGLDKEDASRRVAANKIRQWHCNMRIITRDGKSRWLSDSSVQNSDDAGRLIGSMGILQDITERKQAELSADAFSRLGKDLGCAASPESAAKTISEAASELIGWDSCYVQMYSEKDDSMYSVLEVDTVKGERIAKTPATLRKTSPLDQRILQTGGALILRGDPIAFLPDSQPFGNMARPSASLMFVPIRYRNQQIGIFSIQSYTPNAYTEQDLTTLQTLADQCGGALERIWSNEALRKSESQFRAVWNTSADGMRLANREGIVLIANDAYCRMVEKSKAEIEGQPISIIQFEERAERILQRHAMQFDSAPVHTHQEKDVTLWNGKSVWLELSNSLIEMPGQPSLMLSIFRDITERKQIEAQLFQSQKMETIGKLAGGVAHEFNSLLTAILGQSELLLGDLPAGSPLARNAAEIGTAAGRASTLTRQLLAYGRKQLLQPTILDLNCVIANMEGIIRHLIGNKSDLRFIPAADLKSVRADIGQIEQVIMNIVMNAADAMPNGGKLTMETSRATLDHTYVTRFPDLKAGEYMALAITDSGAGMSPDVMARVFEPFFTTKAVGQGTGLGLSTCYGIIKQSGGHIAVYSEVGRGASFKIYLPPVEAPSKNPASPPELSSLPRGTETILLVEDDAALREMASTLLRRLGYTVYSTGNGIEALTLAHQAATGHVDLLFTDVVMPHMSGKELADRMCSLFSDTKILFTTAYGEGAIVHQGTLDPGVELLLKPFTPSQLAQKAREVLDRKDADR